MKRWAICLISYVETRYISTGVGIQLRKEESFSPPFCQRHNGTTTTTAPSVLPLPSSTVSRRNHHTMDEYIIDAWMRRGDEEDSDAYPRGVAQT